MIDNVYTNVIDRRHISGIMIPLISDYQMYFCALNILSKMIKQNI